MDTRKYHTGMKKTPKRYNTQSRKRQKKYYSIIISLFFLSIALIEGISTHGDRQYQKTMQRMLSSMNNNPFHLQEVKAQNFEPNIPDYLNESVEQTIRRIAKEQNFKWPDYLVRLANCESTLNPDAHNDRGNNPTHSVDRGLYMINTHWHSEVPDSVAYSLTSSTLWTMDRINKGYQGEWACDRLIKANPHKYNTSK